jgi:ethanolamine utilization protein EutN
MDHARILGQVVATRIYKGLDGVRLMVAQVEDTDGKPIGEPIVVADPLQAGVGERVWIVHGREAALACPVTFVPVDHAVVGIVDGVDREDPPHGSSP